MEVACAHLEPVWPEIHSLLQLLSCPAVVPLLVLQLPNLGQRLSLQAIPKVWFFTFISSRADDTACRTRGDAFHGSAGLPLVLPVRLNEPGLSSLIAGEGTS